MFWRWDAVNTVNLGEGDSALTIGINSNTFQARLIRTRMTLQDACLPADSAGLRRGRRRRARQRRMRMAPGALALRKRSSGPRAGWRVQPRWMHPPVALYGCFLWPCRA